MGGAAGSAAGAASGASARAVAGALIGLAQWLVLRRQVSRAGWWVPASTLGFPVTGFLEASLGVGVGVVSGAVFGAVGRAIYGAITGGVMVWLLRQRVTEEPSPPQAAE